MPHPVFIEPLESAAGETVDDAFEAASWAECCQLLRKILENTRDPHRRLLEQHFSAGIPVKVLAFHYRCHESTIRHRLLRAIDEFRKAAIKIGMLKPLIEQGSYFCGRPRWLRRV